MRRKKNEKNKPQPQEPQAWITMLWHMRLRLPWMWRLADKSKPIRSAMLRLITEGSRTLLAEPRMDMPGATPAPYRQDFGHLFRGGGR